MEILLYIAVVLFAAAQSVATKLYGKKNEDASLFNALKAASALLLFALLSVWQFSFHAPTLLYGLLYGVFFALSMLAGYKALLSGPMALTSMLVSFSVALPVLFGILFLREAPTAFCILGLVSLLAAILLIGLGGKREAGKERKPLWFVFVALTFLANGACSILQKWHQLLFPGAYLEEFMLFTMLPPVLLFFLWALAKNIRRLLKETKGLYLSALSGVANGLSGYATLALAGAQNASALFPAISAGTILMSLLCGMLIFKEKPRPPHLLALLFGIATVVLLKI